jgi:RNA polymerase sigma-70 factor (ECF subfamily)
MNAEATLESYEHEIRAACTTASWEAAATIAIRSYGPELLGYLNAMLRDPTHADDVFSDVCEDLWRGLPGFAWQSSFRTWAYTVTRNACMSFVRGTHRRRSVALSSTALEAIAAEVCTGTASFLRTETKDKLAEVRASLDPDDQTLLILRVDRKLPWRDIAQVFEPDGATPAALDRRAAALRKRLERLKDELRELLGR